MDAHKALISNIFNTSTMFEIPFFQRAYVWQEDLWERLLNDMEFISETQKPHFFGSIILKEGTRPLPSDNFTSRETVVDGQQRLTTFLIFLKVLCMKTNQQLFDYQFRIQGKQIALCVGRNDTASFDQVMAMNTPDLIPETSSRIIKAYNYFINKVDPSKINLMVILMNAQFVRIDLNADEDEQEIFDTINSLGVNLTTSELLKNYFFSRETVTEYDDKWASVFEKDDDTKTYWNQEIETGRMRRALIDIFFDAYFQQFIQDKDYQVTAEDKLLYARVDKLSQSYQHFIAKYCHGDKNVILKSMKDYALLFKGIFDPSICDTTVPATYGTERLNVLIFGLKTTTMIPYVLYIAKNVKDPKELDKMYGDLESYVMRRMVCHTSTKNYNNLFTLLIRNEVLDSANLIQKLKDSKENTTYIPNDTELEEGFQNSKLTNNQAKGILYLIEAAIRPGSIATALIGFNGYSLEHLMPKKWRNNWPPCASEEDAEKRDSKLLTLGNLAIIPLALNTSIRDGNWNTKKQGKGQSKPGLDKCAAGLCTMQKVLAKSDWTETDITNRGEWLYQEAKNIWNM